VPISTMSCPSGFCLPFCPKNQECMRAAGSRMIVVFCLLDAGYCRRVSGCPSKFSWHKFSLVYKGNNQILSISCKISAHLASDSMKFSGASRTA
jgi:hypothetical protein